MPTKKQSHGKLSSPPKSADNIVQLPSELLEPLGKLLNEVVLSKQKEREDKEKRPKSRWISFWTWWKDYGASAATIVTIISALIGGLWTLNQYIVQEREKTAQQERQANLERQSLIAQFASDLSDPGKRNASAYAFAILAGEDAVHLLSSELISAAKFDDDKSYQDALVRSLIHVGDPALLPILDVNRQARQKNDDQNKKVVIATQPFLYHYFANRRDALVDKEKIFEGVQIKESNLYFRDFRGIDLSGVTFADSNLCLAKFNDSKISSITFDNSDFGGGNFSNSVIDWFYMDKNSFGVGAQFNDSQISGVFLGDLQNTNWSGSQISGSYLEVIPLDHSNFDTSTIANTYFVYAGLYKASFRNSHFSNVYFGGADLEGVDFSGSEFQGYERSFFINEDRIPGLIVATRDGTALGAGGAFVRGANFQDVTGLSEESQRYLCKWGAINVPGGCEGIEVGDMSIVAETRSSQYNWCY